VSSDNSLEIPHLVAIPTALPCCLIHMIQETVSFSAKENTGKLGVGLTPSVSFYLSLDSVILHYPATNKKERRKYSSLAYRQGCVTLKVTAMS
jgi:hypothetical protein